MDKLSLIKRPIEAELEQFIQLFNESLSHPDGLLGEALAYIRQRGGKRMRPILILLVTKAFGEITMMSQNAAIGLELLHTASLVHDDVVDESDERRGQASVNAMYDNKVSVLVGDYILSTALLRISQTRHHAIVDYLAELGRTLSNGELLQLSNIQNQNISETVYYDVIKQKTAALFEACSAIGALSAGCDDELVEKAKMFGQNLGIAFQIRDDIFDYFEDSKIGKPTGNDMAEGKLTLPVIYAVNRVGDKHFDDLARKVKSGDITQQEIAELVQFTIENGGIEYARQRMNEYSDKAISFINENVKDSVIKEALTNYVEFVVDRNI